MQREKNNSLLIKNMLSNGAFQVLMIMLPIVTTPYVSRIFDPSQIGIFASTYALISFLVVVSSFGIPIYGSRLIAQAETNCQREESFFLLWNVQIVLSVLIFIVINIINFLFFKIRYYVFLQSFLLLANIFDVSWFFIGIEEIKKNLFRNLVSKLFATTLVFVLIKEDNQLGSYILINCLGMFLGNLTMIAQIFKYVSFKKWKFAIKWIYLKESFVLLLPISIESGKNAISRGVLYLFSTAFQAGIYDQGMKIIVMLTAIITSMSNAITPRMAYLVSIGKKEKLNSYFDKFLIAVCCFSIVMTIGMNTVATPFVSLFFGEGYDSVVPILRLGSVAVLPISLNQFLSNGFLIPLSLDKQYFKTSFISATTIVVASLMLAFKFGALGVSMAFLISAFVALFINFINLKNYVNIRKILVNGFLSYVLSFLGYEFIVLIYRYMNLGSNISNFIFGGVTSVIIGLILSQFLIKISKSKSN